MAGRWIGPRGFGYPRPMILHRRFLTLLAGIAALCLTALAGPAMAARALLDPAVIEVPAGPFIAGSDRAEREAAYRLDEAAYGHSRTREGRWYEGEGGRQEKELPGFTITRDLITNRLYGAFVAATGHRAPDVDPQTWSGYRLVHPFERTRRHAWTGGKPPYEALRVAQLRLRDAQPDADWAAYRIIER